MSALAEAFDLLQHIASPASAAAEALADVQATLRRVQGAAGTAVGGLGRVEAKLKELRKAGGISLDSLIGGSTAGARDELGRFVAGSKSGFLSLAGGADTAKSAFSGLKGAIAAVSAGAVLGLAASGAKHVADMASFKENAMFSFKTITGSQAKAAEIMTMADEMARSMGIKTSDVTETLRELMSSGFDIGDAKAITSAQADIKAFNPKADVSGLNSALAKMAGQGKFSMEVAESILRAGVDDSKFYGALQKATGAKDRQALSKLISAGKVTDKQGLAAMLQSVQEQSGGGPLGSLSAEKAATTTGGAIENALAMLERLMTSVNTSPIGKKFTEIANAAGNLFDPAQAGGKRFLGLLDRGIALLDRVFKGADSDALIEVFDTLVSAGESVMAVLEPLGAGFSQGFGEAYRTVMELVTAMNGGKASSSDLGAAMRLVGTALGYVIVGVGVVVAVIAWMASMFARVGAYVVGFWGAIGAYIVEGMATGFDGAKGKLVERIQALAQLLPAKFRELLGIHSPSKVFATIGVQTMAGLDQGLVRGPDPSERMAALMVPPPPPRLAGPSAPAGRFAQGAAAGSQPVQVSVTFERIEISGNAEPEAAADGFRAMFRREILSTFEELSLSNGAAVLAG